MAYGIADNRHYRKLSKGHDEKEADQKDRAQRR
jgi:hypothetical protein